MYKRRGSFCVILADPGTKTRADTAGSDEMTMSLDRTLEFGSSDGGILLSVVGLERTTLPSLYTRKKRKSWMISASLVAIEESGELTNGERINEGLLFVYY